MPEPVFLLLEDILFIHQHEIQISGGEPNIRDQEGLKRGDCRALPVQITKIVDSAANKANRADGLVFSA